MLCVSALAESRSPKTCQADCCYCDHLEILTRAYHHVHQPHSSSCDSASASSYVYDFSTHLYRTLPFT